MSGRGLSAFMFFSNDTRETVKRECPDLQFLQISSKVGRRWKSLTPEQRRRYDEMSAADRMQSLREEEPFFKPAYSAPPTPASAPPRCDHSTSLRLVDDRKQELLAYFAFCQQAGDAVLLDNPTKTIVEIAHLLADRYHARSSAPRPMEQAAEPATAVSSAAATGHSVATSSVLNTSTPEASTATSGPPKPRRALSAFVYFSATAIDTVKTEMPQLHFLERSCEVGRRWREDVSAEERQHYEALAAADKKRYMEEKAVYEAGRPPPVPFGRTRPLSAYLLFCKSTRDAVVIANPGISTVELGQLLSEQWRAMSDEKRATYEAMHRQHKAHYERPPDEDDDDDPMLPYSSYYFFCNANRAAARAEYPQKSVVAIAELLADQWRMLPASERLPFRKMHDIALKRPTT